MVANITTPASGDTATSPFGSPPHSTGQTEYILSFWFSTMWRGLNELMFQLQSPPNTWKLVPKLNLSEHSVQLALQSSLTAIPVYVGLVSRPIASSNCTDNAHFLLRCLTSTTMKHNVSIRMSRSLIAEKFWTGFNEIRYWNLNGYPYPSNVSAQCTRHNKSLMYPPDGTV